MDKISFNNLPSQDTAVSAPNLNRMQSNIEKAVNYIGTTQPATTEKVWYKKGKNLIDPSRLMIGTANTANGNYRYVDTSVVTDFIPVETGTYICKLFNAGTIRIYRVVGYDAYKGYLWDDTNLDVIERSATLTGTKYLRICFKKGNYESGITIQNVIDAQPQLEQNNAATTFENYVKKEILIKQNNSFVPFYNENLTDGWSKASLSNYVTGTVKYIQIGKVVIVVFDDFQVGQDITAHGTTIVYGLPRANDYTRTNLIGFPTPEGFRIAVTGDGTIINHYSTPTASGKNFYGNLIYIAK